MADNENVDTTANVLAVAQRVHDEYVAEGRRKSGELIAEAETKRDTVISEAEAIAEKVIAEANKVKEDSEKEASEIHSVVQDQVDERMKALEDETEKLQQKISKLQEFEISYRTKLRNLVSEAYETLDETQVSLVEESDSESNSEDSYELTSRII